VLPGLFGNDGQTFGECRRADCALHPYPDGTHATQGPRRPLHAIRAYCLDVPVDVPNTRLGALVMASTRRAAGVWLFRFGVRPETVLTKRGPQLVTPELMPSADVNLDDLPAYPKEPPASEPEKTACHCGSSVQTNSDDPKDHPSPAPRPNITWQADSGPWRAF